MEVQFVIDLILDTTEDIYWEYLDGCSAKRFFRCGGCYAFVSIMQSCFSKGIPMIENDGSHWAIFIDGKLWDSYGKIENKSQFRIPSPFDHQYQIQNTPTELISDNGFRLIGRVQREVLEIYNEIPNVKQMKNYY